MWGGGTKKKPVKPGKDGLSLFFLSMAEIRSGIGKWEEKRHRPGTERVALKKTLKKKLGKTKKEKKITP